MKVFYFNSVSGKNVPPDSATETDHVECRRLLYKMRGEGSFIGIFLSENHVLQFYFETDALIWMEVLDREKRSCEGVTVNTPIAEAAMEAAFKGEKIKNALKEYFLPWEVKTLP